MLLVKNDLRKSFFINQFKLCYFTVFIIYTKHQYIYFKLHENRDLLLMFLSIKLDNCKANCNHIKNC